MTYTEKYRRILHRMGYYDYQNGLIYRHLNQESGWDYHLDRCRKFILNAVERERPEKITVLGSGWLLDLPVSEILEMTKEITLVDIVHPPDVRTQFAGFKNVNIIEADVTGGLIQEVWDKTGNKLFFKKRDSLDSIVIPGYQPEEEQGMVISLNILTQLEILLVDFIKKQTRIKEEKLISFRKGIQDKHIDFLRRHRSVLITDTAEIFRLRSGGTEISESLITALPEGRYREEWTWNFDLLGSDYHRKSSVLKVLALIL